MTNLKTHSTNNYKNTFATLATCLFPASKMNTYLFIARLKSIFSKLFFPLQISTVLLFRFFTVTSAIFILSKSIPYTFYRSSDNFPMRLKTNNIYL